MEEIREQMSMMDLDPPQVQAFADHIFDILNVSAQAMFISIGHKTGLITTMSQLPPATSHQIAEAAGLNERYVREWLGGMVVSRIVEYDPTTGAYALPPVHALVLTGKGPQTMADHVQYIPDLLAVEPLILDYFRHGGGLPFSEHPGFKTCVSVGDTNADATLLEVTLPSVPGLVDRLEAGIDVADFGCGSGHTLNVMARAFPQSRFTGYDLLPDNITAAQAEAQKLGLSNARFVVQDLAELDLSEAFDLITVFDVIHDLAKPRTVLNAISAALRSRGTYFMADVRASSRLEENLDHRTGPYFYLWSLTCCMTGSLAAGGEGLGTMWGEQKAVEYLTDAGFGNITIKRPEDDFVNTLYICTKSSSSRARGQ
jgi:2-polyprenyl-3-methyl-5-hydroxy-6-metoxy-1,4-benzoquinol methylase